MTDYDKMKRFNIHKNVEKFEKELKDLLSVTGVEIVFDEESQRIKILCHYFTENCNEFDDLVEAIVIVAEKNGLTLVKGSFWDNGDVIITKYIPDSSIWKYKEAVFVNNYLLPLFKKIGQGVTDMTYSINENDTVRLGSKYFLKGDEIITVEFEHQIKKYACVSGDSNYGILCDVMKQCL